jgi:hypothetical protein
MIDKAKLERELAQIAEARRLASQSRPQQASSPMMPRESLEAELAKIQAARQVAQNSAPAEGFSHRAGQLGRGFLSEIGSYSDIMPYGNNPMAPDEEGTPYQQALWLGRRPENETVQMSEQLPESAGLGAEYAPSKEDTLGKVLDFGGRMLAPTPFLPMAGYGNVIGAAAQGTKAAAKALAKDIGMAGAQAIAIKGGHRLTDEGTIPGAIEDIAKGLGTGMGLAKAGKGLSTIKGPLNGIERSVSDYLINKVGAENVGEVLENLRNHHSPIGYKPLTAEIAENDALAQLYRAQKGIAGTGIDEQQALGANTIKSALENSKRGSDDIAHTQDYVRGRTAALESEVVRHANDLYPRENVTETGRTLQDTLISGLKEKEQARRLPTTPLYESLEKNFSELSPENTLDILNNTIVKGKVKDDYDYIRKQILPKENLTKSDLAYKKSYDNAIAKMQAQGYNKKAIEDFKKSTPAPKSTTPTVAELSAVRKGVINPMLEKYERNGDKTRAEMVRKVKKALDRDLQVVSEQRTADALFHELSSPVSEITENKALRAVTKERYGKPVMSTSRVPGFFINSSARSIDDAQALLRQIHDKPEALGSVRNYLHEKAIMSIADPVTGIVDLKRLAAFRENFPGAKILYPDLYNIKLQNINNAQFATNKFIKNTQSVQKTLERDVFCNLVGGDTKNIMPDTFNKHSARNMKNLVSEVSKDTTGKASRGLQNETIDYFEKSISNRSKVGNRHVLSYDKLRKFIDNHEKALTEVLEPNQMAVVKEIEKIVGGQNSANTRGATLKSDTNANIRNALSLTNWSTGALKAGLTKLGMSTPLISEFFKNFADVRLAKKESVLNKALREPAYADLLMSTPLKSKKEAMDFSEKMKAISNKRYIPPELTALARKEQSNEKD